MGKFSNLTPDEQKQLKEYVNSIKEIKKSINELLKKQNMRLSEEGGNMSTGLTLNVEQSSNPYKK